MRHGEKKDRVIETKKKI